mmetsp:Transcript_32379/g.60222  ORF Transcript_32379/g.60222 Transcript_32379/m.60222 type:complete len:258 (-) Transcript_32379:220-993(-)|eukprot:CAMPEP_0170200230 /NCGR_PEP_ID=MMETSP0040_2-20121228/69763_1 /TAXON_ID=641309 /ORGANISM="Lotharella oceanica, Strain CCMP622" /LENGTH=257 /DNA_ID=CAMNT_0010450409 /DNA_START=126 /DNA_END=899 /DNA_ORIENTATION=-
MYPLLYFWLLLAFWSEGVLSELPAWADPNWKPPKSVRTEGGSGCDGVGSPSDDLRQRGRAMSAREQEALRAEDPWAELFEPAAAAHRGLRRYDHDNKKNKKEEGDEEEEEEDAKARSSASYPNPHYPSRSVQEDRVKEFLEKRRGSSRAAAAEEESRKFDHPGWGGKQFLPQNSWVRRQNHLEPTENRYGIAPGKWWDGVHRGNGFEDRIIQKKEEDELKGFRFQEQAAAAQYDESQDPDGGEVPLGNTAYDPLQYK